MPFWNSMPKKGACLCSSSMGLKSARCVGWGPTKSSMTGWRRWWRILEMVSLWKKGEETTESQGFTHHGLNGVFYWGNRRPAAWQQHHTPAIMLYMYYSASEGERGARGIQRGMYFSDTIECVLNTSAMWLSQRWIIRKIQQCIYSFFFRLFLLLKFCEWTSTQHRCIKILLMMIKLQCCALGCCTVQWHGIATVINNNLLIDSRMDVSLNIMILVFKSQD